MRIPEQYLPGRLFRSQAIMQMGFERGHFTSLASRAKCSLLCCRAIVSLSRLLSFLLAGRFNLRSFHLDRARALREDEILNLASPTEDEIVEGCSWSIITVGVAQTVNEDNPCVVGTVSDSASGEAGFDGKNGEGGERNVTICSIGCPKVEGVKVVKAKSRSVKTGNESSLSNN